MSETENVSDQSEFEYVTRRGLLRSIGAVSGAAIGGRAVSGRASASHLTNSFRGNDDGIYYVRQIGRQVFWFGERQRRDTSTCGPLPFANVFRGEIQADLNVVFGQWFDVPKGFARNRGSMAIAIDSNTRLNRVAVTGGFGGSSWSAPAPSSLRTPTNFRQPGFTDSQLTGVWTCNDGGTYYVRQSGSDVVWFGENDGAFSNVLFANRSGSTVRGTWADVPKGRARGSGSIRLEVESSNELRRVSATGGFGGSRWGRVSAACRDD